MVILLALDFVDILEGGLEMADVFKVLDLEKRFLITPDNALAYADKIGDFMRKTVVDAGMDGYVLGLSGGLDSAVAAYLCKRADIELYPLMMPYGHTMQTSGSERRAHSVVTGLGLEDRLVTIDIGPACEGADLRRQTYLKKFPNLHPNAEISLRLASENRRARQRMIELYDFAQAHNLLVLGTGNLDEYCLGYFTKHGDGASDVEPLLFCLKREVRLVGGAIGVAKDILTCAPSAELSDGQTDELDLGFGYDAFDDFAITGTSGSQEIDQKIRQLWQASRHKRKMPPAFNGLMAS